MRDQVRSTERLEKQIRVLEERKQRAVYSELRVRKVQDNTKKEAETVKEESRKAKEYRVAQQLVEMQEKRERVEAINSSTKGRGSELK